MYVKIHQKEQLIYNLFYENQALEIIEEDKNFMTLLPNVKVSDKKLITGVR